MAHRCRDSNRLSQEEEEGESSTTIARASTLSATIRPLQVQRADDFITRGPEHISHSVSAPLSQNHDNHLALNPRSCSNFGAPSLVDSPTTASHHIEEQKGRKLHEYNKIWRSNYTLSLDGGGVRGYSQLIIIKAIMNKVAEIEYNKPDKDGQLVRSSFHPLCWHEDKSELRPKHKKIPRPINASTNHVNGNGKWNEVEDSNGTDEDISAHFYPYHYFDWIAGTSTGGLNAILLGRLRMSVDECLESYAGLARRVFGRPRFASYRFSPLFWCCAKYSGDRLRDVVKEVVEAHLCESEGYIFAMNKEMCRTVVLAMKKNIEGHEIAHLFRTYDHHQRRQRSADVHHTPTPRNLMEQPGAADSSMIWEVARATSAAPTYFSTIKIGEDEYGDGGFGENNPTFRVFMEVSQMNQDMLSANALTLSIGTGISRFTRFQDGPIRRIVAWINAAKKVSTDCEKTHESMVRLTSDGRKYPYCRLNVPEKNTEPGKLKAPRWQRSKDRLKDLKPSRQQNPDRGLGKIKMDEWKPKRIWRAESTEQEIRRITEDYLQGPGMEQIIKEIADLLVEHRRNKMFTPRWKAYALGIRYECPYSKERCPNDTWTEEEHLRRHLIEDHGLKDESDQEKMLLDRLVSEGAYFEDHH